jgi:hypothetical protein
VFLSVLPELVGASASKVLDFVLGLKGNKAVGETLLREIEADDSLRTPYAFLAHSMKLIYLPERDFP